MSQPVTSNISMFAVEDGVSPITYDVDFTSASYARVVDGTMSYQLYGTVYRVEGEQRTPFTDLGGSAYSVGIAIGNVTRGVDMKDGATFSVGGSYNHSTVGTPTVIVVSVKHNTDVIGTAMFPIVVNGANGLNAVVADFDDEMHMVACDSKDNVVGTFQTWTTHGQLFLGSTAVAIDTTACSIETLSGAVTFGAITLSSDGKTLNVPVTGFGGGSAEVNAFRVTLGDGNGNSASATLKVVKTTLPTLYEMRPSDNVIKKGADGTLTPASYITIGVIAITGSQVSTLNMTMTGQPVKAQYSLNGGSWTDCTVFSISGSGGTTQQVYGVQYSSSVTNIKLRLVGSSSTSTVYDEESIPVVSDGESADVYYITSNIKSISADSSGYPLASTDVVIKVMKRVGSDEGEQIGTGEVYCVWRRFRNGTGTVRSYGTWAGLNATINTSDYADSYQFEVYDIADNTKMLCEPLNIPFVKQGSEGAQGKAGRFYYYDGVYEDREYTRNDQAAPYVSLSDDTMYVLIADSNERANHTFVPPTGASDSGDYWELIEQGIRFLMTEALFTNFARLGSGVFSGDWMLSANGRIGNVSSGNFQLFDDTHPTGAAPETYSGSSSVGVYAQDALGNYQLDRGTVLVITATGHLSSTTVSDMYIDIDGNNTSERLITIGGTTTDVTKVARFTIPATGTYTLYLRHTARSGTATLTSYTAEIYNSFVPNFSVDLLTGDLYARRGEFSGLMCKRKTEIWIDNLTDYGTVVRPSGQSYDEFWIDWRRAGTWIDFRGNQDDDTATLNIVMPSIYEDGTVMGASDADAVRSLIGNTVMIYNRQTSAESSPLYTRITIYGRCKSSDSTWITRATVQAGTQLPGYIDKGEFVSMECCVGKSSNGTEYIYWQVTVLGNYVE